jgi:hypothetical protein
LWLLLAPQAPSTAEVGGWLALGMQLANFSPIFFFRISAY